MTGLFACWAARAVLDLFVDDRLEEGRAGRVAAHLAACAACRAEADGLRPPVRFKGPAPAVPKGLVESILKEYAAEAEAPAPSWRPEPGWRPSPAFAAAAAAAALLLVSQGVPGPVTRGAARPAAEAPR